MTEEAPTDRDAGIHRGRAIARRFVSPDGFIVLVGKTAADNDVLTFKLGEAADFWMHVNGSSGSHVIIRNPDHLARLPKETMQFAAGLAAGYSKARDGGRVIVHVCQCRDVRKPRGVPAGTVTLTRFDTLRVSPRRE